MFSYYSKQIPKYGKYISSKNGIQHIQNINYPYTPKGQFEAQQLTQQLTKTISIAPNLYKYSHLFVKDTKNITKTLRNESKQLKSLLKELLYKLFGNKTVYFLDKALSVKEKISFERCRSIIDKCITYHANDCIPTSKPQLLSIMNPLDFKYLSEFGITKSQYYRCKNINIHTFNNSSNIDKRGRPKLVEERKEIIKHMVKVNNIC